MIPLVIALAVIAAAGWGLAGVLAVLIHRDRTERQAARVVDAARLARLGRADQRARR